ncbi:PucR family transcriptional regulator [Streptomyces triticagri]|uniref:PucR family transcriptional regulator n=1 Tax=Streptomyces triticagri TaxID=2293568 RepID=A0A372M8R5_9ACTN|nr:PucR family transcriptional regulator [Streptomyces triticagri]
MVLRLECAPAGEDIPVGPQIIHGLHEPLMVSPSGFLILVGGAAEDSGTLEVIARAGETGCSAVVLKSYGADLTSAVSAARQAGIALCTVPDDMPWRHFDALVTAASGALEPAQDTYASVGLGDLFALANVIAYQVGGAVSIEDPRGHVLAHSSLPHQEIDEIRRSAILGRQTPHRPGNSAEYERVIRADGPVRFDIPADDHTDRLAMAVRAGSQLLGLVWVLDGSPALGDGAESALEEAAKVTALHLLRARTHRDPSRRHRAEALASLLDGEIGGRTAAGQLGLAQEAGTVVVAFAQSAPEETPGLAGARIVDLVNLYCEAWHPQALCVAAGATVYALLPVRNDAGAQQRVVKFAENVCDTVRRSTQVVLKAGIGARNDRLDRVPAGRRTADRVLRALAADGGRLEAATVEDVRSRVTLLEYLDRGASNADLGPGPVQRIIEHDESNDSAYGISLLAYLDAFGEAIPAAARLSIHENTLRYRIRRIQKLFGLDLDDPETRLVTWLQLSLHQLGRADVRPDGGVSAPTKRASSNA